MPDLGESFDGKKQIWTCGPPCVCNSELAGYKSALNKKNKHKNVFSLHHNAKC